MKELFLPVPHSNKLPNAYYYVMAGAIGWLSATYLPGILSGLLGVVLLIYLFYTLYITRDKE